MENKVEARTFEGQVVWFRLLVGVMIVAAFAVSMLVGTSEAKAATASEPVTRVFVDGELEKKIVGAGTFRDRLSPGCHTARTLQREDGAVTKDSSTTLCSSKVTFLRVTVSESGAISVSRSTNR